jgi:hypothetical protein
LPTQIHPLLLPKEEAVPEEEDEQAAEVAEPESESEETPEASGPAEETKEEDFLLKLDRRNLYQEFSRLEREDQEAANVLNSLIGRKASRKYDPQIRQLQEELEELRSQKRQLEIRSMKPEEIEEKFRTDPTFAEEYAKAVHDKPVDKQARDMGNQIRFEIDDALDRAENSGMPASRVDEFRQSITYCPVHKTNEHGFFDHEYDRKSNEFRMVTSPVRAMKLFTESITRETERKPWNTPVATAPVAEKPKVEVAAPVAEAKKPKPNARLAEAAPDLSPSGGGGGSKTKMSVSEYQQLTPPERQKLFPTMKDYEEARRSGIIHD